MGDGLTDGLGTADALGVDDAALADADGAGLGVMTAAGPGDLLPKTRNAPAPSSTAATAIPIRAGRLSRRCMQLIVPCLRQVTMPLFRYTRRRPAWNAPAPDPVQDRSGEDL